MIFRYFGMTIIRITVMAVVLSMLKSGVIGKTELLFINGIDL